MTQDSKDTYSLVQRLPETTGHQQMEEDTFCCGQQQCCDLVVPSKQILTPGAAVLSSCSAGISFTGDGTDSHAGRNAVFTSTSQSDSLVECSDNADVPSCKNNIYNNLPDSEPCVSNGRVLAVGTKCSGNVEDRTMFVPENVQADAENLTANEHIGFIRGKYGNTHLDTVSTLSDIQISPKDKISENAAATQHMNSGVEEPVKYSSLQARTHINSEVEPAKHSNLRVPTHMNSGVEEPVKHSNLQALTHMNSGVEEPAKHSNLQASTHMHSGVEEPAIHSNLKVPTHMNSGVAEPVKYSSLQAPTHMNSWIEEPVKYSNLEAPTHVNSAVQESVKHRNLEAPTHMNSGIEEPVKHSNLEAPTHMNSGVQEPVKHSNLEAPTHMNSWIEEPVKHSNLEAPTHMNSGVQEPVKHSNLEAPTHMNSGVQEPVKHSNLEAPTHMNSGIEEPVKHSNLEAPPSVKHITSGVWATVEHVNSGAEIMLHNKDSILQTAVHKTIVNGQPSSLDIPPAALTAPHLNNSFTQIRKQEVHLLQQDADLCINTAVHSNAPTHDYIFAVTTVADRNQEINSNLHEGNHGTSRTPEFSKEVESTVTACVGREEIGETKSVTEQDNESRTYPILNNDSFHIRNGLRGENSNMDIAVPKIISHHQGIVQIKNTKPLGYVENGNSGIHPISQRLDVDIDAGVHVSISKNDSTFKDSNKLYEKYDVGADVEMWNLGSSVSLSCAPSASECNHVDSEMVCSLCVKIQNTIHLPACEHSALSYTEQFKSTSEDSILCASRQLKPLVDSGLGQRGGVDEHLENQPCLQIKKCDAPISQETCSVFGKDDQKRVSAGEINVDVALDNFVSGEDILENVSRDSQNVKLYDSVNENTGDGTCAEDWKIHVKDISARDGTVYGKSTSSVEKIDTKLSPFGGGDQQFISTENIAASLGSSVGENGDTKGERGTSMGKSIDDDKTFGNFSKSIDDDKTVGNFSKSVGDGKTGGNFSKSIDDDKTVGNFSKSIDEDKTVGNFSKSIDDDKTVGNFSKSIDTDRNFSKSIEDKTDMNLGRCIDDDKTDGNFSKSIDNKTDGNFRKSIDNKTDGNFRKSIDDKTDGNFSKSIDDDKTDWNFSKSIDVDKTDGNFSKSIDFDKTDGNFRKSIDDKTDGNFSKSIDDKTDGNFSKSIDGKNDMNLGKSLNDEQINALLEHTHSFHKVDTNMGTSVGDKKTNMEDASMANGKIHEKSTSVGCEKIDTSLSTSVNDEKIDTSLSTSVECRKIDTNVSTSVGNKKTDNNLGTSVRDVTLDTSLDTSVCDERIDTNAGTSVHDERTDAGVSIYISDGDDTNFSIYVSDGDDSILDIITVSDAEEETHDTPEVAARKLPKLMVILKRCDAGQTSLDNDSSETESYDSHTSSKIPQNRKRSSDGSLIANCNTTTSGKRSSDGSLKANCNNTSGKSSLDESPKAHCSKTQAYETTHKESGLSNNIVEKASHESQKSYNSKRPVGRPVGSNTARKRTTVFTKQFTPLSKRVHFNQNKKINRSRRFNLRSLDVTRSLRPKTTTPGITTRSSQNDKTCGSSGDTLVQKKKNTSTKVKHKPPPESPPLNPTLPFLEVDLDIELDESQFFKPIDPAPENTSPPPPPPQKKKRGRKPKHYKDSAGSNSADPSGSEVAGVTECDPSHGCCQKALTAKSDMATQWEDPSRWYAALEARAKNAMQSHIKTEPGDGTGDSYVPQVTNLPGDENYEQLSQQYLPKTEPGDGTGNSYLPQVTNLPGDQNYEQLSQQYLPTYSYQNTSQDITMAACVPLASNSADRLFIPQMANLPGDQNREQLNQCLPAYLYQNTSQDINMAVCAPLASVFSEPGTVSGDQGNLLPAEAIPVCQPRVQNSHLFQPAGSSPVPLFLTAVHQTSQNLGNSLNARYSLQPDIHSHSPNTHTNNNHLNSREMNSHIPEDPAGSTKDSHTKHKNSDIAENYSSSTKDSHTKHKKCDIPENSARSTIDLHTRNKKSSDIPDNSPSSTKDSPRKRKKKSKILKNSTQDSHQAASRPDPDRKRTKAKKTSNIKGGLRKRRKDDDSVVIVIDDAASDSSSDGDVVCIE